MHARYLIVTFLPAALAYPSPTAFFRRASGWAPAPGSAVTCDTQSDKIISFFVGPQKETVLNDACAYMMPPCAYQERLGNNTVCAQVLNWKLDGPKTSTQFVNVEDAKTTDKLSGWAAKFDVTPGQQEGVMWTRDDCYGYFERLVTKQEPEGCFTSKGSGLGSIKVGGSASLKDTNFKMTIVKRE